MAKLLQSCVLALAALAISAPAFAETAYVTDQLRLGLYEASGDGGQRLRLLRSGDALEVLERQGPYAQVRTEDGVVGWVKAGFIVTEKPAVLQVREFEVEKAALERQIERLEEQLKAINDPDIQGRLEETTAALESARAENQALSEELETLRARLEPAGPLRKYARLLWTALGGVVLLALGILIGYRSHERRIRRRFAGMRIN